VRVNNIVLIGFMGTGKSSVGRRLARELGRRFVDTDRQIEAQEKMSVAAIFSKKGERYFRERESEMARALGQESGCVIATGGGMALNPANIELLGGIRIALTATPEVVFKRTESDVAIRPLLQGNDPVSIIRKLMADRDEIYRRWADGVIDTSHLSRREMLRRVLEKVTQIETNAGDAHQTHSG
jgi:shikimate kinase